MQSHLALHLKSLKETHMNTDQVKGAVKGIAKQVEGSVQKNYGDAKEDIKDATK